jgi:uncharacterized integral membrane protein
MGSGSVAKRAGSGFGMKLVLQWLILVPIAAMAIAFSVANRQPVTIALDPFAAAPSTQIAVQAPLFLVILVALAAGVLLGGVFTWFAQGRHRRALREARSEMAHLRGNAERPKG